MRIPFIGEHYLSRDTTQQKINMYAEVNTAKKAIVMLPTPGMELFSNVGDEPMRGMHIMSIDETKLYAVAGSAFYVVANDGSWTIKGYMTTSIGLVSMADNGKQILVVDGSNKGYIYDLSADTFKDIADADFLGGKSCAFLDGYFIYNMIDSVSDSRQGQRVASSALYDGTAWDALDFAEAEGDPDAIHAISTNHKDLRLLGRISTEIWYNAAFDTGFPFARMSGGIVEYGLSAQRSHASILGKDYLLGRTNKGERVIVEVAQYQPNIVSHAGINYEIGRMPYTDDAEAFTYMQDGHSFYVITFPRGDLTLVFDATSGMWHRRKSWNMGRWRARCYAFFNGKHLVGDFQNGNIYELKLETYTENGDTIERIIEAQEIMDENDRKNIFVNEIQLDMDLGVGTEDTGQGFDPQSSMECSYDIGKTWGAKHLQPLMKQGQFRKRIMFHRWGKSRRRIFRFTVTDPVKVIIRGATIDAEKGTS